MCVKVGNQLLLILTNPVHAIAVPESSYLNCIAITHGLGWSIVVLYDANVSRRKKPGSLGGAHDASHCAKTCFPTRNWESLEWLVCVHVPFCVEYVVGSRADELRRHCEASVTPGMNS